MVNLPSPPPPVPPGYGPRLVLNATLPGLPHRHVVVLPALVIPGLAAGRTPDMHGLFTHDAGTTTPDTATAESAAMILGGGGSVIFAFMELEDATACLAWVRNNRRLHLESQQTR